MLGVMSARWIARRACGIDKVKLRVHHEVWDPDDWSESEWFKYNLLALTMFPALLVQLQGKALPICATFMGMTLNIAV